MTLGDSTTAHVRPAGSPGHTDLLESYQRFLNRELVSWLIEYRLVGRLGAGGQEVVYLAERLSTDGLSVPVALKVFSPSPYADKHSYWQDMSRIARVAARVALIQHDHLLDVHTFVDFDGVRVMTMEWIDGYDLKHVFDPEVNLRLLEHVSPERARHLQEVVFSQGATHVRLKAGVANYIVRECLSGLAALHREGIAHGDVKPSNVMLKRTGNTKLIDLGSAIETDSMEGRRPFTPEYAAPEVLLGSPCTPASDLASLGYVMIEMLAGVSPFAGLTTYAPLVAAKQELQSRLRELLPQEVTRNELLMRFLHHMIAADPAQRFAHAEAADLLEDGAASFEQQLVKGNLSIDFRTEIRLWLADMKAAGS